MHLSPINVVLQLLANTTSYSNILSTVATNATYVSVSFGNQDLAEIIPWAGTHLNGGPAAVFFGLNGTSTYWNIDAFNIEESFASAENVAVFGNFTYTTVAESKTIQSPFSIWAKVNDGLISYIRFMEDTYTTAGSFRVGGSWLVKSDPEKGVFRVP
ncbi:hypothetical protein OIDMADRAFT_183947 [Oidiodendron maius Zn]|uniref:SnoaL-like domain-containing protein n=1 Tax=Oidiodendron maius (strain Zn) TaxID=913774 RepID=A0A0C3GYZ8_OIDMZ|nr:hypothetical protein OIDMADRAFT_183947 [Oidiodendron maius Zn]